MSKTWKNLNLQNFFRLLKGESTDFKSLNLNAKKRSSLGVGINQVQKKIPNANAKYELNRRRKMNVLLACIAFIFAISWLPLNLFNILSDSRMSIIKADHFYYILNAVCILFGMSSAVSNPILYGVLNENFKREYTKFFSKFFKKLLACFGSNSEHILTQSKILASTDIPLNNINRSLKEPNNQKDNQQEYLIWRNANPTLTLVERIAPYFMRKTLGNY